jgi:formiminoglutamase
MRGRPVLIGFPQDEGVRRNQGRPGAAEAPAAIRRWLYRLTPCDGSTGADLAQLRLLDLGDVKCDADLEASQEALAEVVAAVRRAGAVPIVLGGGHETALGHYLGQARTDKAIAILNLDAHLDLRPLREGRGHSGSPFRQAIEHPQYPLPGKRYVCLGAQPQAVSRDHLDYARQHGCVVCWAGEVRGRLAKVFRWEYGSLDAEDCKIQVTLDADVVRSADVPAVSAPNPGGLDGVEVLESVREAGRLPAVVGFDVVEVCPPLDRDGQSARWAALAVWQFLAGLAERG